MSIINLVYHGKFLLFLLFSACVINVLVFYIYNSEYSGNFSQSGKVLQVSYLNIGQGDAILIKTPHNQTMLIDSGFISGPILSEISKKMPFYRRIINVLLATHPDSDHIGGETAVLANYKTQMFVESGVFSSTTIDKEVHKKLKELDVPVLFARKGMKITLDQKENIYFQVFFPDRDVSAWSKKTNDASIVGKLTYKDRSFYFTGDSPINVEKYILTAVPSHFLLSDVLKVGHHGSRTSTSEEYLQTLRPKYGVISAGKNNRYKHPHEEVLKVLKDDSVQIVRTDTQGSITFKTNGSDLRYETER